MRYHRVIGAPVGAATHLVGAAALGGGWELNTLSRRGSIVRPLFTEVGVARYAGLCTVGAIGAAEVSVDNYIKVVWNETSPVGTYFIVANDKGAQKVIGQFEIPPGGYKARIFVPIDAQGTFIVAGDSGALNADRSIALCTRGGPTGDRGYHAATTSILGAAGGGRFFLSPDRSHGWEHDNAWPLGMLPPGTNTFVGTEHGASAGERT